jgi:hypothetical protein
MSWRTGWTYSSWVVGNSRTRAVSKNWPSPRTRILHSIGTWPVVINDETVVETCVPNEELVLFARVRPATEAVVTLRLSDTAGRIVNASGGWPNSPRSGSPMNWNPTRAVDDATSGTSSRPLSGLALQALRCDRADVWDGF